MFKLKISEDDENPPVKRVQRDENMAVNDRTMLVMTTWLIYPQSIHNGTMTTWLFGNGGEFYVLVR